MSDKNFNIDFVFPYVNPNDKDWARLYEYYSGKTNATKDERFRDSSLLKYIFRSIETYAPWINTVYVLVATKKQIPIYLRQDYNRLKFITHDQFIDSFYLPTFNSNTIEMFLPNIPNLSEHFIYSNDDFIFTNKVDYTDFFTPDGKKIKLAYDYQKTLNPLGFQYCCKATWDIVAKAFNNKRVSNETYNYIKQVHGAASPRLLSDCKACFEKLHSEIYKSLTVLRVLSKNYNQYLYGYYSLLKGNAVRQSPRKIGNYVDASSGINKILDAIANNPAKMLCINDTGKLTSNQLKQIYWALDIEFPEKSVFEK